MTFATNSDLVKFVLTVFSLVMGTTNAYEQSFRTDFNEATVVSVSLISLKNDLQDSNFTQYFCNGTNALGSCMNDLSKCDKSSHAQNT